MKPPARPKSRRHHAAHACEQPQPTPAKADDLPTTAAPSHLGALVTQSPSWRPRARGGFGFVQCDDWT